MYPEFFIVFIDVQYALLLLQVGVEVYHCSIDKTVSRSSINQYETVCVYQLLTTPNNNFASHTTGRLKSPTTPPQKCVAQ